MDQFDPNNPNNQDPNQPQQAPSTITPSRAKQTGTGFTNLSRIIGANKTNQLASTVGSGVSNQVNQAKSSIQTGLNQFQDKANANNFATNDNKQKVQTLINDPTQATDQDAKEFEGFRSGRYDGPTELANKKQIVNQANQASTLGTMSGTAEGRQGLLDRFVGGAGYTQGKQRLDSMLLGQTGSSGLKTAYRDARGLNQQVNAATNTAEEQAKQIAAQNAAFAADTKNKLSSGINSIYDTGQGRMADWNADQDALLKGITEAGKFNVGQNQVNLTQAQGDALTKGGLSLNDPYLFNANLGDVVSKSGYNPTLNAAIQAQEAARAKSLAKLFGNDITEKGTDLLANIGDESKYGTLEGQNKISADQAKLDQLRTDAQEQMLRRYYQEKVVPDMGNQVYGEWNFNIPDWMQFSQDQFIDNIKNRGLVGGSSLMNQQSDLTPYRLDNYLNHDPQAQNAGILNEGGSYGSKSNILKTIDSLRNADSQPGPSDEKAAFMDWMTGGGFNQYANNFGRLRQMIVAPKDPATTSPVEEGTKIDPVTGKVVRTTPVVG